MQELQYHEYANLFPMMGGAEFESFVRDIQQNGLTHPTILLHSDGRILDGRNRYAACLRLGIEVKTETFPGDDKAALAYAVSVNLERRQLTTSQRSSIAAEVATLKHGSNRFNRKAMVEASNDVSTKAPQSNLNTREVGKSRQEPKLSLATSAPRIAAVTKLGELFYSPAWRDLAMILDDGGRGSPQFNRQHGSSVTWQVSRHIDRDQNPKGETRAHCCGVSHSFPSRTRGR